MRILPIFAKTSYSNVAAKGQGFKRGECRKPGPCIQTRQNDVFVRLAEASMKDVKIESELKSMGLI